MKIINIILKLIFIAIMVLFGTVMAIIAPEEHRIGYYIFSLFCFSITIIGFTNGKSTDFVLSLIATIVLITVIFCVIPSINNSLSSIYTVIMCSLLFGYPSLRIIIKLKFGLNKQVENKNQDDKLLEKENNE
jgi:hypothetical protein